MLDPTLFPVNHPLGDLVRSSIAQAVANPELASTLAWVANALIAVTALAILPVFLSVPVLIWIERKVCARMQARLGPMRVGPQGTLQPIADVVKLLLKEIVTPRTVDKGVFYLAPILTLSASFLVLAVIPWDHNLQASDPVMGIPYLIGASGLGILGILIGAWASNNKYSLVAAIRAGAQMLSYEISLVILMLLVVLLAGTAQLSEVVASQQGTIANWWIIKAPGVGLAAFLLYIVSSTAELHRGPFDIAEAEQELCGGFHTEYSGMAFAMFFLAEYANMVIQAALIATYFLGGFLAPTLGIAGFDNAMNHVPGIVWMAGKMLGVILLYMWFRWTFPRPRIDQLLVLEWKVLLPANMLILVAGAALVSLGGILG